MRDATLVVHDWGGAIGMRVAIDHPERVARFVIMDTGIFTGYQGMSDAWKAFRDFVARTEDLPVGFLVRGACHTDPGDDVIAAYDAPFPSVASKAGARAFPLMLPTAPKDAGAAEGQRVLAAMVHDRRPTLMLWADSDIVLPLAVGSRFAEMIGRDKPTPVPEANHFLQEDAGEQSATKSPPGWPRRTSRSRPSRRPAAPARPAPRAPRPRGRTPRRAPRTSTARPGRG